ncbi:hypothetical protein [Mycobacterium tuberculosis]|uniref:hypothetical protein n=1 Tax=Mycobacterium tuberculosis TaxID=1773 RepID=UPI002729AB86|nr:hypothetical protein [Mycobacterium tuberculosis]
MNEFDVVGLTPAFTPTCKAPYVQESKIRYALPHTIANIERTGVYTINHIHTEIMQQAHQTSAKYDASVNEF